MVATYKDSRRATVAVYKGSSGARMRVSIWASARVGGRSYGFSRGVMIFGVAVLWICLNLCCLIFVCSLIL